MLAMEKCNTTPGGLMVKPNGIIKSLTFLLICKLFFRVSSAIGIVAKLLEVPSATNNASYINVRTFANN